jgi:hypothetical protein
VETNHAQAFIEKYGRMFSPSGSSRWLFCSGSIALEKQLKDQHPDRPSDLPSIYASRGTAAHSIAAKCISNDISPYTFVGQTIVSEDEAKVPIHVDNDMAAAIDQYVEYAISLTKPELNPIYKVEQQIDLSFISPYLPYGTADFWCYQRNTNTLIVADYKNGVIDVDPVNNTQMMIYALGVLKQIQLYHDVKPREIEKVILTIAQPNAKNAKEPIRSWETTVDTLNWFHEFVRSVIYNTISGQLIFAPSESRCRWCAGSALCTERARLALASAKLDFHELVTYEEQQQDNVSPIGLIMDEVKEPTFPAVDTLSSNEIGYIIKWQDRIEDFLKAVGEKALQLKRDGARVPGIKLVRGRSNRVWKDPDKVPLELFKKYGIDKSELFNEPKLRSPAQVEALLKKMKLDREEFENMVEKPPGELKLAPLSDKRPEVKLESSAKQDFLEFKS